MTSIFNAGNPELIATIPVDQITAEFHDESAQPTAFAVESGATISDHIVLTPETVEISWMISNIDNSLSAYGTRAATTFEQIKNALKARDLYDVVTRHYLYKNMALVSISAENTSPLVGELRGRVSFVRINEVDFQVVTVKQLSSSAKQTASKKVDAGKVEPAEVKNDDSVADQIAKGFGLL